VRKIVQVVQAVQNVQAVSWAVRQPAPISIVNATQFGIQAWALAVLRREKEGHPPWAVVATEISQPPSSFLVVISI